MIDFSQLMKNFQSLQDDFQNNLASMAVEASSGGGLVTVTVNGKKEVTNIKFREDAPNDGELMADMILAALSKAYSQVDTQLADRMPGMLQGMNIPGLDKIFEK